MRLAGLDDEAPFNIAVYNRLAGGTAYRALNETPFPVPASFAPGIQTLWRKFVTNFYPLRLTRIDPTPALTAEYRLFLQHNLKVLRIANQLLGTRCRDWNEFVLTALPPSGGATIESNRRGVWFNFVKQLPPEKRIDKISVLSIASLLGETI